MVKYRAGKQVVEASQWDGQPIGEANVTVSWTYVESGMTVSWTYVESGITKMHTVANEFEIDETTWIVTTEDGSVFPVADKVFQSVWEAV